MQKMRCKWAIGCLFYFIIPLFIGSASLAMASQENKEPAMRFAEQTTTAFPEIPAMDEKVPTVFETATFGLG